MSEFGQSFVSVLITDIIDARSLLSSADSPVNRRHLVRATLAGVEGLAWHCREHIRDLAREMGHLTPLADMALREQTYTVTEQGEIVEQVRFLSLTTSIRLTIKQAAQLDAAITVDFGDAGWAHLRRAIAIRHRIMHPKGTIDLAVSDEDLIAIGIGFQWFLVITAEILDKTTANYKIFVAMTKELVRRLKEGDPIALELYRSELSRDGE